MTQADVFIHLMPHDSPANLVEGWTNKTYKISDLLAVGTQVINYTEGIRWADVGVVEMVQTTLDTNRDGLTTVTHHIFARLQPEMAAPK